MPYKTNKELPENVRNVLPVHAQDIYREAFNHAWEQYADPHARQDNASREETAHKVAWAAVKHKYKKTGDLWTEKTKRFGKLSFCTPIKAKSCSS